MLLLFLLCVSGMIFLTIFFCHLFLADLIARDNSSKYKGQRKSIETSMEDTSASSFHSFELAKC